MDETAVCARRVSPYDAALEIFDVRHSRAALGFGPVNQEYLWPDLDCDVLKAVTSPIRSRIGHMFPVLVKGQLEFPVTELQCINMARGRIRRVGLEFLAETRDSC